MKEIASDKSGINNFPRHTQINLPYAGEKGNRVSIGILFSALPFSFESMNSVSNPGKSGAGSRFLWEPIK